MSIMLLEYCGAELLQLSELIQMMKNQNSLEQHRGYLNYVLENNRLEPELRKVIEDSRDWANAVDSIRKRYKDVVDKSYARQMHSLFLYNVHLNDHFQTYLELLGHCVMTGDGQLIDKWGILYPFENSCPQLNSPTPYINEFVKWQNHPQLFGSIEVDYNDVAQYLNYLIERFSVVFIAPPTL
ncbi:hypothetical protein N836_18550 [Leptolyngbya sp. Heron Island J]|nr:hypothetical protein N836_18550 [Leptolyngbya sp. Heron Island J]